MGVTGCPMPAQICVKVLEKTPISMMPNKLLIMGLPEPTTHSHRDDIDNIGARIRNAFRFL
jgi:hypothetical protein